MNNGKRPTRSTSSGVVHVRRKSRVNTALPSMPTSDADAGSMEAQHFEAAIVARAGDDALPVPGAQCRMKGWHAARPICELRSLDAHNWATEVSILAKWARGAGIGGMANSVTEAMFEPSSPPRMPRVSYDSYLRPG